MFASRRNAIVKTSVILALTVAGMFCLSSLSASESLSCVKVHGVQANDTLSARVARNSKAGKTGVLPPDVNPVEVIDFAACRPGVRQGFCRPGASNRCENNGHLRQCRQ